MHKLFFLVSLVGSSTELLAAVHRHGQGEILISQDTDHWHIELNVPMSDALGFEHAPNSREEFARVRSLDNRLLQISEVIELSGRCTLLSASHSLQTLVLDSTEQHTEQEHSHQGHDHQHEHHAHEHKGHKHVRDVKAELQGHEAIQHRDLEVSYQFKCRAVVDALKVKVFDLMPSLQRLRAQWINDKGQGERWLTPASAVMKW